MSVNIEDILSIDIDKKKEEILERALEYKQNMRNFLENFDIDSRDIIRLKPFSKNTLSINNYITLKLLEIENTNTYINYTYWTDTSLNWIKWISNILNIIR